MRGHKKQQETVFSLRTLPTKNRTGSPYCRAQC